MRERRASHRSAGLVGAAGTCSHQQTRSRTAVDNRVTSVHMWFTPFLPNVTGENHGEADGSGRQVATRLLPWRCRFTMLKPSRVEQPMRADTCPGHIDGALAHRAGSSSRAGLQFSGGRDRSGRQALIASGASERGCISARCVSAAAGLGVSWTHLPVLNGDRREPRRSSSGGAATPEGTRDTADRGGARREGGSRATNERSACLGSAVAAPCLMAFLHPTATDGRNARHPRRRRGCWRHPPHMRRRTCEHGGVRGLPGDHDPSWIAARYWE